MNDERLKDDHPIFSKLEEMDDNGLYDDMLELINQVPRKRWNVELLCTAASALNNSDRFAEAEHLLEEEKELFATNKDRARYHYLLGYAYYGRGELEKAREHALHALAWNPESESGQDLLLWCKQDCFEAVLDGTHKDEDFSWVYSLNIAFYDSWLIIKGTEQSILEKIQIFSELNPDDSNAYEFTSRMITDENKNGPFMVLACPDGIKTGDILNFTLWFEDNAFLLAYHRLDNRFSFVTAFYIEERKEDALTLHFENNLAAFISIPNVVGAQNIETGFNEDTSYHTLQTVCQEFRVSKEDLENMRKMGKKKIINFMNM